MAKDEFIKMLDSDIALIEDNESRDPNDGKEPSFYVMYNRIISKYAKIIDCFAENMTLCRGPEGYKRNLITLKEKLMLFKAMGCENIDSKSNSKMIVNNTNINSNTIEVGITFEKARKEVEDMSALTDSEVDEILSKIDELEKIVKSDDRKTKKWENAKGIVKWIADKGVDVALTLLPLLLQMK